jgi:hypothetical protein
MERSHSGLVRRTRNAVRSQGFRGFESHPLRQEKLRCNAGAFLVVIMGLWGRRLSCGRNPRSARTTRSAKTSCIYPDVCTSMGYASSAPATILIFKAFHNLENGEYFTLNFELKFRIMEWFGWGDGLAGCLFGKRLELTIDQIRPPSRVSRYTNRLFKI